MGHYNPGMYSGMVDILEIFHARQLHGQVGEQLRRIRRTDARTTLCDPALKRDLLLYYEALESTTRALLTQLGDRVETNDSPTHSRE